MARSTTQARSIATPHDGPDLYGRLTNERMRRITARRARRATRNNIHFIHRAKNGIYDPLTYYHLLDALCRIGSGQEFRTAELLAHLKLVKPQLVWDGTVVGRVMSDLAESLHEAHGFTPIGYVKRWNGMTYDIIDHPSARDAMVRLLEDLEVLCEEHIAAELRGEDIKRLRSPLERCASVMRVEATG